jgi:hypothetical protein
MSNSTTDQKKWANRRIRPQPQPFGATTPLSWPGGAARVTVAGKFLSAAGVGTSAELIVRERTGDGVLQYAKPLRTFTAPGEYKIHIPPGEYHFQFSGPTGTDWRASAEVQPPSRQVTAVSRELTGRR